MATNQVLRVNGLQGLQRAFALNKKVKKEVRAELRHVADPVRATAEQFALGQIRNIGPQWSQMRIGVTQRVVYVAPKQRGRRYKRPNLAQLLLQRSMEPALEANRGQVERNFNEFLARLGNEWERA